MIRKPWRIKILSKKNHSWEFRTSNRHLVLQLVAILVSSNLSRGGLKFFRAFHGSRDNPILQHVGHKKASKEKKYVVQPMDIDYHGSLKKKHKPNCSHDHPYNSYQSVVGPTNQALDDS